MKRNRLFRSAAGTAVLAAAAVLALGLGACSRGAPGSDRSAPPEAAGTAPEGASDSGSATAGSGPAATSSPAPAPEAAVFEYRYTSVRIEDPRAVLYRAEFRFHPDGTLRSAELRELRGGTEARLASAVSEPFNGGYKVTFRSFGKDPGGYEYTLGWSGKGLTAIAGGETTGFRLDPADRVFTIPWDKGSETYSPGPAGSFLGELVLSGKRQWFGRYLRKDGTLKFEEIYPDGSVDREMILKPFGPDLWSVSCTGAADSFYEGKLSGVSLFPRGGNYPASAYNLILITDLWMTEERYPFFALSLLE